MRYLACIKYNGSKYYGFQKLKSEKTVQEELEKALTKINKKTVYVKGAGRTDRGVHAYKQMIHFDLDIKITSERLKKAINSVVDSGIYVNYCEEKSNTFHSRFEVKKKTYEYIINLGEYNPITNDYIYNYGKKLNIDAMKKATEYFLGYHDFEAYVCGKRENYDSGVFSTKIKIKKEILTLTFTGKNFYQYMVRNMVGALIMVGENKIEPVAIKEMLDKKRNLYNYSTAPAQGLYLKDIKY